MEGAGVWAGAWTPLPELELSELELELVPEELELLEGWVVVCDAVLELWPWNDLAATAEMAAVSTTAPAMSQRLTRRISSKPASLALTGLLLTLSMMVRGQKKTLSRR